MRTLLLASASAVGAALAAAVLLSPSGAAEPVATPPAAHPAFAPTGGEVARKVADPEAACAKLKGWTQGDVVIETAEHQAAGTSITVPMFHVSLTAPAHCLIEGAIAKRTGADGKPYQISFELRLPDDWNGRFLYQGGGGFDGFLAPAVGFAVTGTPALDRGFAVISTDAGHRDSGKPGEAGDYGLDPQARIDFAYHALDRVAVTGKALVRDYYGRAIDKSYFVGCSGGGRQAMMVSQKFPDYFDGLVAGAPASRIADIGLSGVRRFQAIDRFSPDNAMAIVTPAELQIAADAIVRQCDALDGQRDGLIFNQKACHFKTSSLLCKSGQTAGCLTQDRIDRLDALIKPTINPKTGRVIYNAMQPDPTMTAPAWLFGLAQGLPNYSHQQSQIAVQHAYFTPPSNQNLAEIKLDEADAAVEPMRKISNMTSTDLDRFRAHGGKIIYYHGTGDQIIAYKDTTDYVDALQKRYGAGTGSFARFFPVPGMLHCMGGTGLTDFDPLTAIMDWVEKGKAPDRILAGNAAARPGESRPLCPYPGYARYDGKGDPKQASSYSCTSGG